MWIFRRHRHLKLELLSEYLDGRLGGAAHGRVSREVDSCGMCRDELATLRSTVSLLGALPELTPPRSFTLAAPPEPWPSMVPQPLLLRAPGWAYAGAASLAGLALAIMISVDSLGLLAPTGGASLSSPPSDRSGQSAQFTAAPEDSLSAKVATPQPQTRSMQPNDSARQVPVGPPEVNSIPFSQGLDGLPEAAEAEPAMAQAAPDSQSEPMALAAETEPGAADAVVSPDSAIEGTGFSESPAGPGEQVVDPSTEGASGSQATLQPEQYQGAPFLWRVLEGMATALILVSLGILLIKRWMSRRIAS